MYAIVLSPSTELRDQASIYGQKLDGKTPVRAPGNPSLFEHTWRKDEHEPFAKSIPRHTVSFGGGTATVSETITQTVTKAGIRLGPNFAPLLLLLESGIQWIKPDQLALLVALKLQPKTQSGKAFIRSGKNEDAKEVNLEVGSVVLLFGDNVGWELQEGSISFLHIPFPMEPL